MYIHISCTSLPSNPIHSEISPALILWDNHSLSWVLLQDLNERKVVLSFNVLSLSTKTSEVSWKIPTQFITKPRTRSGIMSSIRFKSAEFNDRKESSDISQKPI